MVFSSLFPDFHDLGKKIEFLKIDLFWLPSVWVMGLWLGQWLLGPQMDKKWMGKITQVLNLILERSVALVGWFLRNIVWLNDLRGHAAKGFFLSWLWKAATAGILPVSWHTLSLRCSCLSGPILTLSRNKVIRLPHNQQALRIITTVFGILDEAVDLSQVGPAMNRWYYYWVGCHLTFSSGLQVCNRML